MLRAIVLLVALVAAGAAAFLALNLRSRPAPVQVVQAAPTVPTQDVLVASADLKQGEALSEKNLRWQAWPEAALNKDFIRKADKADAVKSLTGSLVRTGFVSGEPIREAKIAHPGSGFLSAILPSGKRAVAVRVSADTTAGGFILPNDRVDILQTVSTGGDVKTDVTRTILQNVPVLAIDQMVQQKDGQTVVVGKTATLELDPPQTELITAAATGGSLFLALRSIADSNQPQTAATEDQPSTSSTVRIFRAGQSQIVTTK